MLPLDLPPARSLLDAPFTPAMARAAGVTRRALERMLGAGRVRRILRGVYVDSTLVEDSGLRAAATALVVSRDAVVVDRTAAWIHGADVLPRPEEPPPVDVVGRSSRRHRHGSHRRLAGRDVELIGGLHLTTPLRTALDLGRLLGPDRSVASMDALLRTGRFTHPELIAELARFGGRPGGAQLRRLAPLADARAAEMAESVLRLRWLEAALPTPVPALRVGTPHGRCRLALGLVDHRFAAALLSSLDQAQLDHLVAHGWRVVVLDDERLLHSDPHFVSHHLEREFRRRLLEDWVGGDR